MSVIANVLEILAKNILLIIVLIIIIGFIKGVSAKLLSYKESKLNKININKLLKEYNFTNIGILKIYIYNYFINIDHNNSLLLVYPSSKTEYFLLDYKNNVVKDKLYWINKDQLNNAIESNINKLITNISYIQQKSKSDS